jgi:hypothetical protein
MPNAVCPNCGSASFACEFQNIKNLPVPIAIIYCNSCLAAIGSVDSYILEKISRSKKDSDSNITLSAIEYEQEHKV